jgi:hypothetical protein
MRQRPGLLATIAVLCIAAGTGQAQYVEDSVDVGGAWVGSLAYNSREDVVLEAVAWAARRDVGQSAQRSASPPSIVLLQKKYS